MEADGSLDVAPLRTVVQGKALLLAADGWRKPPLVVLHDEQQRGGWRQWFAADGVEGGGRTTAAENVGAAAGAVLTDVESVTDH